MKFLCLFLFVVFLTYCNTNKEQPDPSSPTQDTSPSPRMDNATAPVNRLPVPPAPSEIDSAAQYHYEHKKKPEQEPEQKQFSSLEDKQDYIFSVIKENADLFTNCQDSASAGVYTVHISWTFDFNGYPKDVRASKYDSNHIAFVECIVKAWKWIPFSKSLKEENFTQKFHFSIGTLQKA